MHDARLDGRVRPGHPNRIGEAFQSVAAHDQRITDAAVAQLGEHRHPLLRTLPTRWPKPQAEHVTFTVEIHAYRHIHRPVGDSGVADLHHDRINQQHRIKPAVSNGRRESCSEGIPMPHRAWNKAPSETKRRYFELIRQGLSGSAASQQVGVSLSCGSLWFTDAGSVDFGTITGSNEPARSRGTANST